MDSTSYLLPPDNLVSLMYGCIDDLDFILWVSRVCIQLIIIIFKLRFI